MKRRQILKSMASTTFAAWTASSLAADNPIKVGIALDLTGPIASAGLPMLHAARAAFEEINSGGGVLGRKIELVVEDTASNESVGVTKARKLVSGDKVSVVFGGITSSMRNAIKDPIAVRGRTPYFYPMLYEGGECTPGVYLTGPLPVQQCEPIIDYLNKTGAKRYYLLGSNYVYPRTLHEYAKRKIGQTGGQVVGEDYYPVDQSDFSSIVQKVLAKKPDVVFTHTIPPGVATLFKQLAESGFKSQGRIASVFMDEALVGLVSPADLEGTVSCLDYFPTLADPVGARVNAAMLASSGNKFGLTAGSGSTGMYRAVKLWAAAVAKAGSINAGQLENGISSVGTLQGPGGEFSVAPGTRHLRLPMYVGVAKSGRFEVMEKLGATADTQACKKT